MSDTENPISELNELSHSVGCKQPLYEEQTTDGELSSKFSIKVTFSDMTAFGTGSSKVSHCHQISPFLITKILFSTYRRRQNAKLQRRC